MEFAASPALRFDTNSTEFARGVEIGMVWAMLTHQCPEATSGTYHESNARMIQEAAHATGYIAWISKSGAPGWIRVEFSREPALH